MSQTSLVSDILKYGPCNLKNPSGVKLTNANLRGANLSGLDLSGADMRHADLRDANLFGANLSGANLSGANLEEADLTGADLMNAEFVETNLYKSNLSETRLIAADFSGAFMHSVVLDGADFVRARFSLTAGFIDGGEDSNGFRCALVQWPDEPMFVGEYHWMPLSKAKKFAWKKKETLLRLKAVAQIARQRKWPGTGRR